MRRGLVVSILLVFALLSCQKKTEEAPKSPEKVEEPKAFTQKGAENQISDKGIGPITEVKLGPLDQNLVKRGRDIFDSKCGSCHKLQERYVGPPMKGVTKKRKPEWIMNLILNPSEMEQKDPVTKQLLAEYLTPMPYQNVSQDEARAILEYLRSVDEK